MRILKAILYFLLLLLALVLLAMAGLTLFINPNKMKPVLINQVKNKTGYQLVIDGDLHWSFFPHFSIKAPHMTLTAPQQTSPFLDVTDTKVAMNPSQLWQKRKNLKGQIDIGILKVKNIRAQNVTAKVKREGDSVNILLKNANLYSGVASGVLIATHPENRATWNWNLHLDQVDVGALLQDASKHNDKIKLTGALTLNFRGTTAGKDKSTILSQMNAAGDFKILTGLLKGTDFNYFVQMAKTIISNTVLPLQNTRQTLFKSLTGTFTIEKGILYNNDLLMIAPAFNCVGKGTIDLLQETLSVNLQLNPFSAQNKWNIPLQVTGPLNKPKVKLDMIALKAMAADLNIQAVEEHVTQQLKELPEKADKFLKKLLGG